jgi:hypothetical protein
MDFGQLSVCIPPRTQTGAASARSAVGSHPQRRFLSRPDFLHASQFHPAWFENWKWNATISFFFRLR